MHRDVRVLLFTVGLATFCAGMLFAQRGAIPTRAPLPSSTALGAGALSTFPSSTAQSTMPAGLSPGFGVGRPGFGLGMGKPGFGLGPSALNPPYNRNRGNGGVHNNVRRDWRPLPYAYVAAPYYYPTFDWGGDYSPTASVPSVDPAYAGPDPATDAMLRNQAALSEQIQHLTDELTNLRSGQPNQQQPPQAQQAPGSIPLTVVMKDGTQYTVQNYAITGSTLWDFAGNGTARKIPVFMIDIAASSKATEANGGEFPPIDTRP